MQPKKTSPLLIGAYLLALAFCTLSLLEIAVRYIGFGDPILYYNAAWGGLRPIPGQQVERLAGVTVTVDDNGYRSAHPETQGSLRVLFLGDSVTWGGSRVDDSALFTEVAADVLRRQGGSVYAMNAGVNGTSLVNQAEIFSHLSDVPIDVLVWLFPWSDVERSYAALGFLWPPRFKPRFALVEVVDHLIFRFWLNAFREKNLGACGQKP